MMYIVIGINETIHSRIVANRNFPVASLYVSNIINGFPNLSLFSINKEIQNTGIDTILKMKPKTVMGNLKIETKEKGIINRNKIRVIVKTKFI